MKTELNDTYFLNNFNTHLEPQNEQRFQNWVKLRSKALGRNLALDLGTYDLRGYWLGGGHKDTGTERVHGPDTYKKPNHPTFSDESIYHGATNPNGGPFMGGSWVNQNGSDFYMPSPRMMATTHNKRDMEAYFQKYEPGVGLILPTTSDVMPKPK